MSLLRTAIAYTGGIMFGWSSVLFFRHLKIIETSEGRAGAAKKNFFDVMIWRILSCCFKVRNYEL